MTTPLRGRGLGPLSPQSPTLRQAWTRLMSPASSAVQNLTRGAGMNPVTRKAARAGTKANVWLYRRTSSRIGGRGMGRLPLLLTVPGRRSGTAPRQVAGADGTRVPGRSAEPQAQRLMTQRWQSAPRLRPGHEGAGRRCAGPPATATSAPSGTDELADAVRPYSSGPPPCRTWSDEPWPPPTCSARYRSEAWLSGNHGSSGDPAAACRGCARRRGRRPFATC
jgi:hypothetical protein